MSNNRKLFIALISLALLLAPALVEAATPTPSNTPGELPKTIVPSHYTLDLRPDLKTMQLAGSEVVDIKVEEKTDRIVLNALKISIDSATIDDQKTNAAVSYDEAAQTATLSFPAPIAPGEHKLRMAFTSRINPFGEGLFYVDYRSAAGHKRMIASQLEPTDARRIFPCWDEPAFKASFEPTVTVPANFLAVSNMPVAREEPLGRGMKRVSFKATPPMSSYLFVLVAGEMERRVKDVDGVTVGVVTQAGKQGSGDYALESAVHLLHYYDEYFGVKYPLPKLDLIAVPGGFGGAMENWGGITFYEGILLYDPSSSPKALQLRIFSVVAHEMAHQWFGDLVTMAWWNDLWLNEGFADWMQAKVEDRLHPDWHVWLNQGRKQGAMYADARTMSHPIEHPVGNASEAAIAFDEITYAKGAAIVRVIENYLGADGFRSGIRRYIKEHEYGNATTHDLWRALEAASGKHISSIARAYTEQPGLPLIVADERCRGDSRSIALRQERFTIDYPDARPELWEVPIAWGVAGAQKPSGTVLMRGKSIEMMTGPCGPPIKLNLGDVGYYRVQYDPATLTALTSLIETMQPADRVDLLNDNWALLEAGRAAPANYFPLVRAVARDDQRAVWREVIDPFLRIDHLERRLSGKAPFEAYARSVLRPPFDRLGWNAVAGEPEGQVILRSALISALGKLDDEAVIAEARRRFKEFLQNPASLDVNLRDAVVQTVGRYADQQTYDELHKLARATASTREQMLYYSAMASAHDPRLAEQALALTLGDELEPERAGELILIVAAGEHPELALKFAEKNFARLAAGRSSDFRYFFMSRLMSNFAERSYAKKLAEFGPVHETSGGRIAALRAQARIRESADFREHQIPEIDNWVKSNSGKPQA
jgi:aminopeptidase N